MEDISKDTISDLLSNMKFKKKLFCGVDELDVWKKIELLQKEYEKNLEIEKSKYQDLIKNLKMGSKDEK